MKKLDELYTLLESFELGNHNEEIFATAIQEKDLPEIAMHIKELPSYERLLLQERLHNMVNAIELYQERLRKELTKIQEDIFAGRKKNYGHISYLQASAMCSKLYH